MSIDFSRLVSGIYVPDDDDYINEVSDILQSEVFQSMQQYIQHGETTCMEHCLWVSYKSYLACKSLGWNSRAAARAGLLHDLFLYDWHDHAAPGKKFNFHGFTHPLTAYKNAKQHFKLTHREKDIILKHMWPLTIVPARFRESYVVMHFDRVSALGEVKRRIEEKTIGKLFSFEEINL